MVSEEKYRIAVIGASGYTGAELVRLLYRHPNVDIVSLVADRNAGQPMANIYPHLRSVKLPDLQHLQEVPWDALDAAFFCLPHGTSQEIIASVPKEVRVIDLSADFRLFDLNSYKEWYGKDHAAPEVQKEAVYGLSEVFREPIRRARVVACPGCYPTSVLLPLMPLLDSAKISTEGIIIDSKSGVTGAGRSAKTDNLFAEINEGVKAYGIPKHRHLAEIEQALAAASATNNLRVTFTPQLVPMNRGILSTIYVKMMHEGGFADMRETLESRYEKEHFVSVLPAGESPSTHEVSGTNHCYISIFENRIKGRAIIVSVIDNLVKGASGQAVQNFNIMFGLSETTGLRQITIFP